jgi:hypothetical protein
LAWVVFRQLPDKTRQHLHIFLLSGFSYLLTLLFSY